MTMAYLFTQPLCKMLHILQNVAKYCKKNCFEKFDNILINYTLALGGITILISIKYHMYKCCYVQQTRLQV